MTKLQLLEHYQELIECDPSKVSSSWKAAAIFLYATCSLSSYACIITFYNFWVDCNFEVCGGNCLAWAEVQVVPETLSFRPNTSIWDDKQLAWTKFIKIRRQSTRACQIFHFVCLFSCSVSMILLMMFMICGEGGSKSSLLASPWRITVPANICNVTMMIVTLVTTHIFLRGYLSFMERLHRFALELSHTENHRRQGKGLTICRAFEMFAKRYKLVDFDPCDLYFVLQMTAWTMSWSWAIAFVVLFLRILASADFVLMDVKIYEMPRGETGRESLLKKIETTKVSDAAHAKGNKEKVL